MLLLNTLNKKKVSRPPIWMMRQAGRLLKDYRKLREKYSLYTLMSDPEKATQISIMPVKKLGVDAAIIFTDILVIPDALGMELDFKESKPYFHRSILKLGNSPAKKLILQPQKLEHIYKVIQWTRRELDKNITLIGFSGAPLTTFAYMMDSINSRDNFINTIKFIYENYEEAMAILEKITQTIIHYAQKQVSHGVEVFQIFDTWAGLVDIEMYMEITNRFTIRIINALKKNNIPVIFFPRGLGAGYFTLIDNNVCDCYSIDWQLSLKQIVKYAPHIVYQGNLDPRLLLVGEQGYSRVKNYIQMFQELWKNQNHTGLIFNLGHGVMPNTDEAYVKKIIEEFKQSF